MLDTLAPGHYRLTGRLTMEDTADLGALLALAGPVDLDLSGLEAADSVLLAALVHLAREAEKRHSAVCFRSLSDGLRALARTYGIDGLIERCLATAETSA